MPDKKEIKSNEASSLNKMQQNIEEIKDPGLKEVLSRVMERIKHSKDAEEFKKEVLNTPVKPEQKILAFLPH